VFAGPVDWTENMTGTELNPTAKDWTSSCSCQSKGLTKNQKTKENQFELVATSLFAVYTKYSYIY